MHERLLLKDLEATRRAGRALAALLEAGDVVALLGDLGAGKTSFAKAAISALCGVDEDEITSPTFVLVHEYGPPATIHMDAYRLASSQDLLDLDLKLGREGREAAQDSEAWIAFVEWAERVADALPADRVVLEFEHDPEGRRLSLSGHGARGLALAKALGAAL